MNHLCIGISALCCLSFLSALPMQLITYTKRVESSMAPYYNNPQQKWRPHRISNMCESSVADCLTRSCKRKKDYFQQEIDKLNPKLQAAQEQKQKAKVPFLQFCAGTSTVAAPLLVTFLANGNLSLAAGTSASWALLTVGSPFSLAYKKAQNACENINAQMDSNQNAITSINQQLARIANLAPVTTQNQDIEPNKNTDVGPYDDDDAWW